MKKCGNEMRGLLSLRAVTALAVALAVGLMTGLSGCVSNKSTSSVSVGLANQYFGTAAQVGYPPYWSGGIWGITVDSVTGYFDYDNVNNQSAYNAASPNGTFTTSTSGILDLTLTQGSAAETISDGGTGVGGYAVTLPGEGLLMRTGSSSTDVYGHSPSALIAATHAAACPGFTSAETFEFVAQGTTNQGDSIVHVAYGSV